MKCWSILFVLQIYDLMILSHVKNQFGDAGGGLVANSCLTLVTP